ncbi:MAG: acyl-CoA thioesterase [Chloroflexi bacterium]|nr:acyl-CoA thioesterase [Chloroflexota bacterium]
MPSIHERIFRVRHYECDAYGHVNHANYLRYMQEAAMDASAAVGYDNARYRAIGRSWWIRETDISYQRPLTHGDSLIVKTWVADFHRVRSLRHYEIRHAATGEIAAEAQTDWVYLDSATQRPEIIPPEMITAFVPEGLPDDKRPPRPFVQPPPPAGKFTLRRRVEWRDIDPAQHVNNATYLAFFEDSAMQDSISRGWPVARMSEAGFALVIRRYRIEYKLPAVLGDDLDVSTWISDVKRSTALRHFTAARVSDGALVARAFSQWVWVDLATGRPIRIPPDFIGDFASNIVGWAGAQG